MQNSSYTESMPKKTLLAACYVLLYSQPGSAAESVKYDSSFLMGSNAASIDISKYPDGNPTPTGTYSVKVFANEKSVVSLTLPFVDVGKNSAQACLTSKNLAQLHVKQPEIGNEHAVLKKDDEDGDDCLNLPALTEQSNVGSDMGEQCLDIPVPQAWLIKDYSGYVEPSLWESGIPAVLFFYILNGYHSTNHDTDSDSLYTAFNTGTNLGVWRLRASGNYNWAKDGGSNFGYQNHYL